MKITNVTFLVLIIGIVALSACSNNVEEPKICTKEYMPQCGVDGKTYDNKCLAGDVEIAYEGKCGAQIANPASEFCVNNGGELSIETASDGSQVGYCTIDSITCEEWSLFRGECEFLHICTIEEQSAQACTMEYMPVCAKKVLNVGEVVYETAGNKCAACASMKTVSYTPGECTN